MPSGKGINAAHCLLGSPVNLEACIWHACFY